MHSLVFWCHIFFQIFPRKENGGKIPGKFLLSFSKKLFQYRKMRAKMITQFEVFVFVIKISCYNEDSVQRDAMNAILPSQRSFHAVVFSNICFGMFPLAYVLVRPSWCHESLVPIEAPNE